MLVTMYSLKFTQLFRDAKEMVAGPRAWMSKFILGVSMYVVKKCEKIIIIGDIYITKLMTQDHGLRK